jgi:hypothetical protein
MPAAPNGEFELAITLPGNANTGSMAVDVTATAGSQSASLPPYTTIAPPK